VLPADAELRGGVVAVMIPRSRATWYAISGAVLSLGEPIGLLMLRELSGDRSIVSELSQEFLTYAYVFVTMAIVFSALGYLVGRQADRLALLSQTDALTQLPNRRAFQYRLSLELRRAQRYRAPMSLLLADVDGLKRINDEHGHAAGDQAIRRVADAIMATLRASDFGARWGGDEFAIVLPNADTDAARHSAERLLEQVSKDRDDTTNAVTISVGIATFVAAASNGTTVEQLAQDADGALYTAKSAGKNRIAVAPREGEASAK
jgi:diguanylate cyclase (GGDEF)-like protein